MTDEDKQKIRAFDSLERFFLNHFKTSFSTWPLCSVDWCLNRPTKGTHRCYPHASETEKVVSMRRITTNTENRVEDLEKCLQEIVSSKVVPNDLRNYVKTILDDE